MCTTYARYFLSVMMLTSVFGLLGAVEVRGETTFKSPYLTAECLSAQTTKDGEVSVVVKITGTPKAAGFFAGYRDFYHAPPEASLSSPDGTKFELKSWQGLGKISETNSDKTLANLDEGSTLTATLIFRAAEEPRTPLTGPATINLTLELFSKDGRDARWERRGEVTIHFDKVPLEKAKRD